jgi:hypothetical protein
LAKEPEGASPEDAFIREVDEEYRRDQLTSFWTRYGRLLLIVIGLGLVVLAAFLWWREEQAKQLGELSEQFTAAQQGLEIGDPKATAELERFAAGDYGGYTVLARFKKAGRAVEQGDNAAALAEYNSLAGDNNLAQPLRDLATMKAVRLQYDDLPAAQVIAQLKPLVKPGAPWFGVAGEMLALAYIRDGKSELAGPIFASISSDESIPPSLRQRAQQMAASLGTLPIPEIGPDGAPLPAQGAPAAAPAEAE